MDHQGSKACGAAQIQIQLQLQYPETRDGPPVVKGGAAQLQLQI